MYCDPLVGEYDDGDPDRPVIRIDSEEKGQRDSSKVPLTLEILKLIAELLMFCFGV